MADEVKISELKELNETGTDKRFLIDEKDYLLITRLNESSKQSLRISSQHFKEDLYASGFITSEDLALVKARIDNMLNNNVYEGKGIGFSNEENQTALILNGNGINFSDEDNQTALSLNGNGINFSSKENQSYQIVNDMGEVSGKNVMSHNNLYIQHDNFEKGSTPEDKTEWQNVLFIDKNGGLLSAIESVYDKSVKDYRFTLRSYDWTKSKDDISLSNITLNKDVTLKSNTGNIKLESNTIFNNAANFRGTTTIRNNNRLVCASADAGTSSWINMELFVPQSNTGVYPVIQSNTGLVLRANNSSAEGQKAYNFEFRVGLDGNDQGHGVCIAKEFALSSSIRYKENIRDLSEEDAKKLFDFRPVMFDYKNGGDKDAYGFIAEEVVNIEKQIVGLDKEGKPEGINYTALIPQLVKLCQMQQKEIDELKKAILEK